MGLVRLPTAPLPLAWIPQVVMVEVICLRPSALCWSLMQDALPETPSQYQRLLYGRNLLHTRRKLDSWYGPFPFLIFDLHFNSQVFIITVVVHFLLLIVMLRFLIQEPDQGPFA